MKRVAVRAIDRLVSKRPPHGKHTQRQSPFSVPNFFEDSTLQVGALCTQQKLVVDIKRVLIVHRRMIRRIVQGIEIVLNAFDLRALLILKSEPAQYALDLVRRLLQHMLKPNSACPGRHRDVDAFRFKLRGHFSALQFGLS